MKNKVKYLSNSKKGIERERNQDRILIINNKEYDLFILFDGVSSNPFSYLFINEYKKRIKSKLELLEKDINSLSNILFNAHNEIVNEEIDGLSTLSVLLLIRGSKEAKYINIGDTRIYIYSNQYVEKITVDHSLKEKRNILTKCLGMQNLTLDDFAMLNIDPNNNFLMCTDGFYELMEGNLKEYFKVLNFKYFRNIEKKISYLQRKKNRDDSSYIIIKNEISG